MIRTFFTCFSFLCGPCIYATSTHQETEMPKIQLSKIEQYLENSVEQDHFSGAVIVVQNGNVLLNRGYGMATETMKNQSDTVIHVASVTKQFTAAAIMLLWERGQIDLDASINSYLPEKYRSDQWEKVTVHHLLSHTGGVPDYAVERDYYDVRKGFCFGDTVNGMIHEARNTPLEFEPGSQFKYSNIGYTLLGIILEEQTGCPYKEFIQDNLLIPAGMTSSGIHDENYVAREMDATGHRWDESQKKLVDDNVISLPVTAPDGGLFTTTEDLLKWSDVIAGKTKGILSAKSIEKMTTPYQNTSFPGEQYGYGLFIDDSFGTRRIHHPGWIVGFRSHFCLFPEKGIYIAVLCNLTTNPMKISEGLSKIILDREPCSQ